MLNEKKSQEAWSRQNYKKAFTVRTSKQIEIVPSFCQDDFVLTEDNNIVHEKLSFVLYKRISKRSGVRGMCRWKISTKCNLPEARKIIKVSQRP